MKRIAGQRPRVRAAPPPTERVSDAVRAALLPHAGVTLAVSGGRDSMVLLHAAAAVAPERVRLVATYDHGTGRAATAAAALVRHTAAGYGFPFASERAQLPGRTEAEWRTARWAFLRAAAAAGEATPIATAHTEDDHVETVFMRALRGAGPRGLAALAARGPLLRPLLGAARSDVAAYAATHAVAYITDPSNATRTFLRNRVRHDLLPAVERCRPGFRAELLGLAERAALWRAEVDDLASTIGELAPDARELGVPVSTLRDLREEELAVLWPALAARAGVTLDWRGTRRLTGFTKASANGAWMPLSGGATVRRDRERFVLRASTVDISPPATGPAAGRPGSSSTRR